MPRTTLTATQVTRGGTKMAAEANGDTVNGFTVPNSGNTKILVRNADVTNPYVVTIHARAQVDGLDLPERTRSIPATEQWVFGPYDRATYGDDLWIDTPNAALKVQVIEG